MNDPFIPDGSLFRFDPDGSFHKLDTGYATANGIGVSPDGRKLYVADQRHRQIIALDYDPDNGTVSNRRLFARLPDGEGMPDGLILDAQGFVWSGHWDGWRLTRYDPDGRVERQVRFPVQHVISFAFGGRELDELFVTTSTWDFDDEQRKQQPWALRPGQHAWCDHQAIAALAELRVSVRPDRDRAGTGCRAPYLRLADPAGMKFCGSCRRAAKRAEMTAI